MRYGHEAQTARWSMPRSPGAGWYPTGLPAPEDGNYSIVDPPMFTLRYTYLYLKPRDTAAGWIYGRDFVAVGYTQRLRIAHVAFWGI